MAELQNHWGVTGSISFARPTEEEVSANAALIEELKSQGSFESAEESQKRLNLRNGRLCMLTAI
jgi:poly(A) polymerase